VGSTGGAMSSKGTANMSWSTNAICSQILSRTGSHASH
jgi:hypothetical protein